jgi:hypothetical protein
VLEQIEGDSVEDGEVLCGVASAFAVQVFSEATSLTQCSLFSIP